MPRLTEQEQQEIIRYIEADKPLPDKFRFLLFEDKREVELVWNAKTNEVCNIVLPFQVIEQVDEPRAEPRFQPRDEPSDEFYCMRGEHYPHPKVTEPASASLIRSLTERDKPGNELMSWSRGSESCTSFAAFFAGLPQF